MDISPKYIGDDLVLLLGLTDAGAEQLINGGKQGGAALFNSMEKWNPNIRTDFRLTWVQVWGILLQAWTMKHIQQIVAAMGEMVDLDDDTEDKRRLDRARVLVKTPWNPPIKHTVEVHIGDERFNVFVVEECGGGSHDYRRSRRSLSGSSEEIDSDESYSGSSTPRSSLGMVDAGLVAEVPATSKPLSIVDPPNNADEDRQTKFLPTGFSDHHYTPGKASISRVQGSRCQATSCDQTPSAVPQPTVTCHRDTQSKCGKQKDIGSATPAEMTELNHAKGKSVLEESCEESTSLGAMGRDICNKAELGDVAETHPTKRHVTKLRMGY